LVILTLNKWVFWAISGALNARMRLFGNMHQHQENHEEDDHPAPIEHAREKAPGNEFR
jgi:hypothetical protein